MASGQLRPWHLLWTMPLAIVISVPIVLFSVVDLCGISGCTGGGFGVSYGSLWPLTTALVSVPFALSIGLVSWGTTKQRWTVAIIVGAGVAGLLGLSLLWLKYSPM